MTRTERIAALEALARDRVLILDGAMGTQIQDLNWMRTDIAASGSPIGRARSRAITDILNLTTPMP